MKTSNHFYKRASFAFLFILLFSIPDSARAGHLAGASISYRHLGGNMYRMNVTLYRDCLGIAAEPSVQVNLVSVTCNSNTTITLSPIFGTGQEISLPCPGVVTTCNGGSDPGFEKWEYENDFAIPAICSDWIFTMTTCCRTGGTIQPGSFLTVEARLDNLTGDNNSAQFTNDAFITACINRFYHFNHGMTDQEGDSLVYLLVDAIGAIYNPPYTGQNPVTSVPPASLDTFTGDYVMFPLMAETGPIAFEIREYRNGTFIGSAMREFTYYSVPCANEIPTASYMNGTTQQVAYVFPNDTICFDIFTDDLDPTDSVTLTWNQAIPAATFTATTALHPTGTFCWTPSLADERSQPYMFTAMATDNNCPSNGAGIYSYFIYVTLDSSLVSINESAGHYEFSLTISPNPSTGVFAIQCDEKIHALKVYNPLGTCVVNKKSASNFSIADQAEGIYTVELQTNLGIFRKKIILSR